MNGLKRIIKAQWRIIPKRIIVSYLLVFIIPLVLAAFIYSFGTNIIQNRTDELNRMSLEQANYFLENQFRNLERFVFQIKNNNKLKYMMIQEEDDFSSIDLVEVNEEIVKYPYDPGFIASYQVYIRPLDVLLYEGAIATDITKFYDYFFVFEALSQEEWKRDILYKKQVKTLLPATHVEFEGEQLDVIPYFQSLHTSDKDMPSGAINVYIDRTYVGEAMEEIAMFNGSVLHVYDEAGNLIVDYPVDVIRDSDIFHDLRTKEDHSLGSYNKENYVISSMRSDYKNLTYVMFVPENSILRQIESFRNLVIIMMGITLTIGLVVIAGLSFYNTQPVRAIVKNIRENMDTHTEGNSDVYRYISHSLDELMVANSVMKKKEADYKSRMKDIALERLIKGEQSYSDLLSEDLNRTDRHYCVILLRFGYPSKISEKMMQKVDVNKALITSYIEKYFGDRSQLVTSGVKEEIIIIEGQNDELEVDIDFVESFLYNLKVLADSFENLEVDFSVGDFYPDMNDLSLSYNQAVEIMAYKELSGDRTALWYDEIPNESHMYYYPIAIEQKLMNYIRNCELDKSIGLLDEIYEGNLVKRKLPRYQIEQLVSEIRGTMLKVIYQINQIDEGEAGRLSQPLFDESLSLLDYIDRIKEVVVVLIDSFSQNMNKNKDIKKLTDYIDEHYMDEALSLASVADMFDYKEVHLSTEFKQKSGMTFSAYVEGKRMKEGCRLLRESSLGIDDIASAIGYSSTRAFRRAFKRVQQVPPSEFRSMYKT